MKLAIISDIHGNYPALKAVLEDIPNEVEKLVCCGDIVGYNGFPSECVDEIREQADVVVTGNHDSALETPGRYENNPQAFAGLLHASEQLTSEQKEWIRQLPRTQTIQNYLVVHSHPDEEQRGKYVMPRNFPEINPYIPEYSGCFLGHTHVQHKMETNEEKLILNPGSVGQPRDKNPDAAYAIVDSETNNATLHRVEYNIQKTIERNRKENLPEEVSKRLRNGE